MPVRTLMSKKVESLEKYMYQQPIFFIELPL